MDGNTTDSGKYHGERNILIDEDVTGKTTPSEIMQTISHHNDKATNEKGGLEDEALLSSIKHEIPRNTVSTENTGLEDCADNSVKDDKEEDMSAVETEKCVSSDNLHEPSPLKQNVSVCDHSSHSSSNNTLVDEAQHNAETTEKMVASDTVESTSTETTKLVVIVQTNREDGETPDKAPVDSVYREKQDESCDSSSDSEESVIFVQEEHDKIIVIESDDQEENK